MKNNQQTKELVLVSLLGALIFVMAFTPYLGFIPLGFMNATIVHIPVIIGSIILGPRRGAVLGFLFGLASFIHSTIIPQAGSFIFTPFYPGGNLLSLIVCFVPRILTGVVPYFTYKFVKQLSKLTKFKDKTALVCAGVAGSMTNTLLVMNLTYIFFEESYAEVYGIALEALYMAILTVIGVNGVPEAIIAGIITAIIVTTIGKIQKKAY